MNTKAPTPVSIGCEAGGPEAAVVCQLKVPLYRALAKHVSSTHCSAVDEYAIVLRVDGSLTSYGEEGLARLRYAKKRRYITVDVQVPANVWQPMDVPQIRGYLGKQVQLAIATCVARLKQDKHIVDAQALKRQVDAAVAEYLATLT